ncbi:coiled-coil domain-containing protein 136-like isoform X2 [Fagus crenata]
MAEKEVKEEEEEEEKEEKNDLKKILSTYLGLSFSVWLALVGPDSVSLRLSQAEEQLRQMRSRRKEDSKANARVVEIFASRRDSWRAEERRLLEGMEEMRERVAELEKREELYKARLQDLEREVAHRDDIISFMSNSTSTSTSTSTRIDQDSDCACSSATANAGLDSISKYWAETPTHCQDVQYESLESLYHMKHFVPRESPWKVDGESTGVSSKLKVLEQELLNLEKVGNSDLSKVPSLMRKQAKRYQALSGKIDDLCGRMQASDPCEPNLSSEFRTQRQTEFLLEAFRLQQRASETGQKLIALQTEVGKSYYGDELGSQAKLTMRRSLDSIRNNLKEIQRNMEIWLARIIGDLEGILARDGASRVREYYISRYPFVQ